MKRIVLVIAFMLWPTTLWAMMGGMKLVGEGRAKYLGLITVYDAALYIADPADGDAALNPDVSRCLKLDYAVAVSAGDFITAAGTILRRQHPEEKLAGLQAEIKLLHDGYSSVGKGDSYALCYQADSRTTTLYRNRTPQVEVVSAEFAEVYFGIWLGGNQPLDEGLRNNLLGRK